MKQSTAECRPNQKHGHQLKHDRKKGTEVENYDINRCKIKAKLLETGHCVIFKATRTVYEA